MQLEKRVDVAYALVVNAARDLLVVRNQTSFSLPGGRREPGETLAQAAIRETLEETSLRIETLGIIHVSERIADVHDLFITFGARLAGPDATRAVGGELPAYWMSIADADPLMPWYGGLDALVEVAPIRYAVTNR